MGQHVLRKRGRLQCSDMELPECAKLSAASRFKTRLTVNEAEYYEITAKLQAAIETDNGTSVHMWGFQPGHQADGGRY